MFVVNGLHSSELNKVNIFPKMRKCIYQTSKFMGVYTHPREVILSNLIFVFLLHMGFFKECLAAQSVLFKKLYPGPESSVPLKRWQNVFFLKSVCYHVYAVSSLQDTNVYRKKLGIQGYILFFICLPNQSLRILFRATLNEQY